MTDQYHIGTMEIDCGNGHPGRGRALLAKRQPQSEARKKREIEVKQRTATQLRKMIASLEQEIASLDISISSELGLGGVRKPAPFAYPISAMTMEGRRENLKVTVAALLDRLALSEV